MGSLAGAARSLVGAHNQAEAHSPAEAHNPAGAHSLAEAHSLAGADNPAGAGTGKVPHSAHICDRMDPDDAIPAGMAAAV